MDPRIVVSGGIEYAHYGSCFLHEMEVDGGESGGEVFNLRRERSACVPDLEGNKLHPSPIFLDDRD